MTQKAIFITGAGSGIGRATALRFAREGWRVGLADVSAAGIDETAAMIAAAQGASAVSKHVMDVRDRDQWQQALNDFTTASGGRLDVLFNNAGVAESGPFAELTPDKCDRLIAVNFNGVVNGAMVGRPFLAKTPGSVMLNTASASAIYGTSGLAVYSATKFAVRGLTEALEAEWVADGIKVRALIPGFIDTPLLNQAVAGRNADPRETIRAAGMEVIPVEAVADAAWDAVHGDRVHTLVGPTARRLMLIARLAPGTIRRRMLRRPISDAH